MALYRTKNFPPDISAQTAMPRLKLEAGIKAEGDASQHLY